MKRPSGRPLVIRFGLETFSGNLIGVERIVAEQEVVGNHQRPRLACADALHFQGHFDPVRSRRVLFKRRSPYNPLDPHILPRPR